MTALRRSAAPEAVRGSVPGVFDIMAALIATAVAVVAGVGVRSWHRKRAVPLVLRVGDEVTAVLNEDGELVLAVATAVILNRKAGGKLFTIELVEATASPGDREIVRFSNPPTDPALGRAYNGFVAACCMRARSAMKVGGFRAMRLTLENKMSGPGAQRFDQELRPKQLLPLGIYL